MPCLLRIYFLTTNVAGGSADISLIRHAGCKEGSRYLAGFTAHDTKGSPLVYEAWDVMTTFQASTSPDPSVAPLTFNYGNLTTDHNPTIVRTVDNDIASPTFRPSTCDLRLLICSATYGGREVTDFITQAYVTSTLTTPPTYIANGWLFVANNRTMGFDPAPGKHKSLCVIYRVGYIVGTTSGPISVPKDPAWNDPAWTANPPLLPYMSTNYPLITPLSGFKSVACREGSAIFINLTTESLAPIGPPLPNPPGTNLYVAKAVWDLEDVTTNARNSVAHTEIPNRGHNGERFVGVSFALLGVPDPWVRVEKCMTVLYAKGVTGPGPIYWNWYTATHLPETDSSFGYELPIPKANPQPLTQAPAPMAQGSRWKATGKYMGFVNRTAGTLNPEIMQGGNVNWKGDALSRGMCLFLFLRA